MIATTPEVKRLGIQIEHAYFKIKKICESERVTCFSSNFSLYGNMSKRLMGVLKKWGKLHVYSIDEAFIQLPKLSREIYFDYAKSIGEEVYRKTGLSVGVGIAPSKTLAKIANHWAKRQKEQKIWVLDGSEKDDEVLKQVSIDKVWGVGRQSVAKMHALGIKTAKDLKYFSNEKQIQGIFSIRGLQMKKEIMGISCLEWERIQRRKQLMVSRGFPQTIYSLEELKKSVAHFVVKACEKLRKEKSLAQAISISLRTSPHYGEYLKHSTNFLLESPSADTQTFIKAAWKGLEKIYQEGLAYKKAGICLWEIYDEKDWQPSLFHEDCPKRKKLTEVVDQINQKAGSLIIRPMACGEQKSWQMRREKMSPRYTSSWKELPKCS